MRPRDCISGREDDDAKCFGFKLKLLVKPFHRNRTGLALDAGGGSPQTV